MVVDDSPRTVHVLTDLWCRARFCYLSYHDVLTHGVMGQFFATRAMMTAIAGGDKDVQDVFQ